MSFTCMHYTKQLTIVEPAREFWYFLHARAAKVQARLHKYSVLPEPSLLTRTK